MDEVASLLDELVQIRNSINNDCETRGTFYTPIDKKTNFYFQSTGKQNAHDVQEEHFSPNQYDFSLAAPPSLPQSLSQQAEVFRKELPQTKFLQVTTTLNEKMRHFDAFCQDTCQYTAPSTQTMPQVTSQYFSDFPASKTEEHSFRFDEKHERNSSTPMELKRHVSEDSSFAGSALKESVDREATHKEPVPYIGRDRNVEPASDFKCHEDSTSCWSALPNIYDQVKQSKKHANHQVRTSTPKPSHDQGGEATCNSNQQTSNEMAPRPTFSKKPPMIENRFQMRKIVKQQTVKEKPQHRLTQNAPVVIPISQAVSQQRQQHQQSEFQPNRPVNYESASHRPHQTNSTPIYVSKPLYASKRWPPDLTLHGEHYGLKLTGIMSNIMLMIGWGATTCGILLYIRHCMAASPAWSVYGLPTLMIGVIGLFLGIMLNILYNRTRQIQELKYFVTNQTVLKKQASENQQTIRPIDEKNSLPVVEKNNVSHDHNETETLEETYYRLVVLKKEINGMIRLIESCDR